MKILTVNRHTSYLYLLSKTGYDICVIPAEKWGITAQRPVPHNVSIIDSWNIDIRDYDIVIGHDPLEDMIKLGIRCILAGVPYIQVFHGRIHRTGYRRNPAYKLLKQFYGMSVLRALGNFPKIKYVFISKMAQKSWKLPGTVIVAGIDPAEMLPYNGNIPSILVVGNDLHREHFEFEMFIQFRKYVPITVVGRNPKIPESKLARDWDELRLLYSSHRAYFNFTREPEEGWNLATLEAMATGMPVLTVKHPTSPIIDGYNGLVCNNLQECVEKARLLLNDIELARKLGEKALETVLSKFNLKFFVARWREVIHSLVSTGTY